jgi:hypothetical protein
MYLANIWPKSINDKLLDVYMPLFNGVSNDDILEAGIAYTKADVDRFPTPAKLKSCVPTKTSSYVGSQKFILTTTKIRCQVPGCLKVDICIKEPSDDPAAFYKCRDCYSGLTFQQRNQRLRDIMHMIKDKKFKPAWV